MDEQYDLEQVLEEIKQDELLNPMEKRVKISQEDIKKLFSRKVGAKKKGKDENNKKGKKES